MTEFKISLTTGNRFWTPKGLGAMGMDPHRAIAELVANSLDWRKEQSSAFEPIIQVVIGHGFIQILDNGIGMTSEELQDAVQVSVANDQRRKNLRIRKGMFGMGMKVACLSLGWKITFHTRSINEKGKENTLILDTRKLDLPEEQSSNYRNKLKGVNSDFLKDSPLNGWESGTSILIEDLTHKSLSPISVKDSLQEIFNPEIAIEQVTIQVVDLEKEVTYTCESVEVPVFEKSKIILDDLDLFVKGEDNSEPIKIKGWIGLMKSAGSGTGKWGLHLFKNNQIIERYHQLPSRLGGLMPKNPHPRFARTYGEIHLDMCRPAFHKVGFDYSTDSWKEVQVLLEPHLSVIMEQSDKYKVKDFEKAEFSIKTIQKHKRASKQAIRNLKDENVASNKPENAISLPDGDWFTIVEPIFEKLSETERVKPWIYHYSAQSREIAIVVNKASSVYQNAIDDPCSEKLLALIVNWAICDSIFLLLSEEFDYSIQDSLRFRDEQLSRLYKIEEEL